MAKLDSDVKKRLTGLVATAIDTIDADGKPVSRAAQEGVIHFLRLAQGSNDEALRAHAKNLVEGRGGVNSARPIVLDEGVGKLFEDIYFHGSGITPENGNKVRIWLETGELPDVRKT
jgi:hypothetical protein